MNISPEQENQLAECEDSEASIEHFGPHLPANRRTHRTRFQFSWKPISVAAVCLLLTGIIGCGNTQTESEAEPQGDGHADHADVHQEPADFSSALAEVESMKTSICEAFANGTPDDAHDALHKIGHSLEHLPELAAKGGELSEEQLAKVGTSVEALFDGFAKLDDTLHGGAEVDVEELEKELNQALSDLKEAVQ